jgi:branched-chain amino acid transport system substrate-binding protein
MSKGVTVNIRSFVTATSVAIALFLASAWSAVASPAEGATPAPAGPPIVLAMITQEAGPAAIPDSHLAAQAAVNYVNAKLGGAAGRPLKLVTCVTDGSPEESSACANQLLADHPLAFVGESELGTAGSVPIIAGAGIPIVGPAAVTPELVTSPDAFSMGINLVSESADWTKYMTTKGKAKTVNLINLDIAAAPIFKEIVASVAAANGAKLGVTTSLPETATDATAQMAAASAGHPGAILAITTQQLCVPVMLAHASVAPDIPLYVPGICGAPNLLRAAGSAANGVYIGFGYDGPNDTSIPAVTSYRKALAQYGSKKIQLSEFASNAFAAVMNLRVIIDQIGPSVTPAAVTSALKATVNQPNFMGEPYTCNHRVPLAVSACASAIRMLKVENDKLVDVGGAWYDGTNEIKLG